MTLSTTMDIKYLIDSDWIIKHLRGDQSKTTRIEQLAPYGIALSIMVKAEVYVGTYGFADSDRREQDLLLLIGNFPVIPLNEIVGTVYVSERNRLKRTGKLIGDPDLLIGATAIGHGLTLLTDNRRDFCLLQNLMIIPRN